MKIFKELGWFFKKEKWSYFWGIVALLVIAIVSLIPPKLMGDIIDGMDQGTLTPDKLIAILFSIIGSAIIIYALRYVWRICIFGASYRLERSMRLSLFEHFTKMSSEFYQTHRIGDLMAHATNDLKSVQRVAGNGILQFADALITGVSVLLAMAFTISWQLTLITMIPMPIMIFGSQYLSKKLHITFNKAQEAFSDMNNRTHETVSGIKVTKTFGQEEAEIALFKEETEDVYRKNMAVTKFDAAFDPLITIVIACCFILIFIFGAHYIQEGMLTIGQLIAFVNYVYLLVWPMLAFGFLYNTVERGNVSYQRIRALLNSKPDIQNPKHAIKQVPQGNITVNIATFSYPQEQSKVLENIQFDLTQGHTLGLVGKTGAGKTTIIKLLLKEYDRFDGKITFGNYAIDEYDIASWHKAIGYVPQDQFLFSATVEDNIRFGNPKATLSQVQEAAKLACVDDDIMGFDLQYQTIVGERGVSLSGGQKQRIAIARALLLEPELLILDDALSAVDAKTEEAILEALRKQRENKTTIIIAHRLSALQQASTILVIKAGKVIERGNHSQLLKNKGWYNDMYTKQELRREAEEYGK